MSGYKTFVDEMTERLPDYARKMSARERIYDMVNISSAEKVLEFESEKDYVVGVLEPNNYFYYMKYAPHKYYKLGEEELRVLKLQNTSGFPF